MSFLYIHLRGRVFYERRQPPESDPLPRYADPNTGTFDFGPVPESSNRLKAKGQAPLIAVGNSELYTGYRRVISDNNSFKRIEGSVWPVAKINTSEGKSYVQLRPEQADEPLVPEDLEEISHRMWEQAKSLSDIQADVLDILTATWLKQANTVNDRAVIDVDDFCRMRGLKPKLGGCGRRGGYGEDQRLTHLRAAQTIFDCWIVAIEIPIYAAKGNRPGKSGSLQSRPFIVTDRFGEHRFSWGDSRCHDNFIDVRKLKYTVGEVIGVFLMANRQTALLSERALRYSLRTQIWEKRLTRYYSYLWRCRARRGDFLKPVRVSSILGEGLRINLDPRRLARQQNRLCKCHRTLERDGVITDWQYERQDGPWPDWTVRITPPPKILSHYFRAITSARLQGSLDLLPPA
jgi:hypothetical protein